jgi:ankyrin repeat protein
VNKLIASGADIDQLHDLHGMAPLHLPAGNNQLGIVNTLLQAKVKIIVQKIKKATPLHMEYLYSHYVGARL